MAKYVMNKFPNWLEANRGIATVLATKLNISTSNITNAKTGRLLMPTNWMPLIVQLSKSTLSFEDLVLEREENRTRQSRRRIEDKKNNSK